MWKENKMSEEEKEAIETLSIKAVTSKAECEDYPSCICLKKDLLLILNLIEKQQKEKDKLEKHNKELLRKLRNRVKEVKKLNKYSLYKKEFAKLNKEIEKKDKIIDLMSYVITHEDIPQEEYCIWRDMSCEVVGGNKQCKNCIKQYFERKV
jgi:hypothetical protein